MLVMMVWFFCVLCRIGFCLMWILIKCVGVGGGICKVVLGLRLRLCMWLVSVWLVLLCCICRFVWF